MVLWVSGEGVGRGMWERILTRTWLPYNVQSLIELTVLSP